MDTIIIEIYYSKYTLIIRQKISATNQIVGHEIQGVEKRKNPNWSRRVDQDTHLKQRRKIGLNLSFGGYVNSENQKKNTNPTGFGFLVIISV